MNLKKVLLSSAAALALTSGAAFAADSAGAVATVAQDQTGDYLVFPAYYANSAGWSTNIKVVNTNTTHAVVAKVVIREYVTSAEKLDFPIYLTPGDVFEATLENVGGTVYVKSTDDSMFQGGNPASATNAVNQALFPATGNQNNTMGYVEVFGFAAIPGASVTSGWTPGTALSKATLYSRFNSNLNGNIDTTGQWVAVSNDSIYGQEVISAANANGNLAMTLMATAFENVTGSTANNQVVLATDSTLTNNTMQASEAVLVDEIEDALQKSRVYVTYYNNAADTDAADTALLLNQPMKKYRYTNASINLTGVGYTGATPDAVGPDSYTFKYTPIARNQMEQTNVTTEEYSGGTTETFTCKHELCQIDVIPYVGTFTKGYVDVSLLQSSSYPSMPVIPAVMTAKSVGGTNITNIVYPAYAK